jgi:iron complex outermembrane receptor protein
VDSEPSVHDRLTIQGDYYDGRENEQAGGTAANSGANLLGRWTRTVSAESDFSLQGYVDQTHLGEPVAPLMVSGLQFSPAGTVYDDLTTYDVDFQHRFSLGGYNHVVWGLGYRRTHDAVIDPGSGLFSSGSESKFIQRLRAG